MNKDRKFMQSVLKNSAYIVMLMGIAIRFCYIIFTKVVESRQYDLGQTPPDPDKLSGHLGYIFYLFQNKKIPNFDPRTVYQYYHPPLHHAVEAVWMSVAGVFVKDKMLLIELLQIPTFIYSSLIIIFSWLICRELKLCDKATIIVLAIMSFHPSYIFMAGSINNDGLSLMFQFLIILYAIKWYKYRSNKNIVLLALFIGLGMITKLSAGLLAVPVAFLFIYVLINDIKTKNYPGKQFLQYVLFGVICVPLGLSWSIRCLIKYDMPLNYAYELSKDSWQYVGNHSYWEIFFLPNIKTLLGNLKNGGIGLGENMWIQLFRTSALGECDLSEFPMAGKMIALLMICMSFAVAFIAFTYMIKGICLLLNIKKLSGDAGKESDETDNFVISIFLILSYIVFIAFYISFIYKYPFECTMNFRYILPTVFVPSLFMAKYIRYDKKVYKIILGLYCIISILTVAVWCI